MNAGERHSESGAVTVLMLAVFVVGAFLALGLARLGVAAAARARAETAADAAALAAADMLVLGRGASAALAAARETAAANGARLMRCDCRGSETVAEVSIDLPAFVGAGDSIRVRARAEIRAGCVIRGVVPGACGPGG